MSDTFNFASCLNSLLAKNNLSFKQAEAAFSALLSGNLTPVQISGLVVALRMKGETPDEVAGGASVMRQLVTPVEVEDADAIIDLCGTGGDGAHTFNISTASMFVLAACGAKVAKHGGRSVSSSCGSADVLEAMGVNINLQPAQVAQCIQQVGIGFMFAPNHHSAMRFAGPVRKELGVRTVFNALGPLTNPAGAKRQLMGVYSADLLEQQAEVLRKLGSTRAMIVHGESGLDEITLNSPTQVAELKDGQIVRFALTPEDLGLARQSHDDLSARSKEESLAKIDLALKGEGGAIADIVAANAGVALYVAGKAETMKAGVELARQAMLSGKAEEKRKSFIMLSQSLGQSTN